MALKITAVHPNYPKGTEIAFGNFFLAKVDQEVEVSDETIAKFKTLTGNDLRDSLPKGWNVAESTATDTTKSAATDTHSTKTNKTKTEAEGGDAK